MTLIVRYIVSAIHCNNFSSAPSRGRPMRFMNLVKKEMKSVSLAPRSTGKRLE